MKKILIVDDNRDNRLTLELLVEEFQDVEILTAENGLEAVKLCQKELVDLILMDIMMPVMDGIEATQKIRHFNKRVMIVAVSALDDEKSKDTMILHGCEDYITKPIDASVFSKRIKNYLDLIDFRKERKFDNQAINLFTKEVNNRYTIFRIHNKPSLGEFWEYFLVNTNKDALYLSECIRIIYALAAFILETRQNLQITHEENDQYHFFTVPGVEIVGEDVVRNILNKHYPQGKFVIQEELVSFMLEKLQPPKPEEIDAIIKSEEQAILRKEHKNGTHATEYVENTPINLVSKIEDLEMHEDELDVKLIEFEAHPDSEKLQQVGEYFYQYALVIEELVEFQHLAYAIESLSKMLKSLDIASLDAKKQKMLATFLLTILEDITNWRKTIFILKEARDIHYLDASLLSSCMQTEMLVQEKKPDIEESELELF